MPPCWVWFHSMFPGHCWRSRHHIITSMGQQLVKKSIWNTQASTARLWREMGWLRIKFGKGRGCVFPWQMSARVSNFLSDLRVWFLRDALTNNTSCLRAVPALGGTFSTHCGWMWERQGGNDAALVLTGVSGESTWEAPQSPIALNLPHGAYTSPFLNSIGGQQGSWKLGQTWCRALTAWKLEIWAILT